jgi:hypothetical protein
MFRFLKELYLTGFTLGFRVSGSSWSPAMNASKGVGGVSVIEWIILVVIAMWIELHFGTKFFFTTGKWAVRIACLALYLINYYVLVIRGHGIEFEREFSNLEKSRKNLLLVSCAVLLLATIAFMAFSVSAYHHFFHIIPKSGW